MNRIITTIEGQMKAMKVLCGIGQSLRSVWSAGGQILVNRS